MAFWHKWFTRDSGEVDVWPMVEFPGNVTPVEIERLPEPKAEEPAPFVPPEPDLSTKPQGVSHFEIALSCPDKHFVFLVDNIAVDPAEHAKMARICSACGKRMRLAVLKVKSESGWGDAFVGYRPLKDREVSDYGWSFARGSRTPEFVRWLKKPTK